MLFEMRVRVRATTGLYIGKESVYVRGRGGIRDSLEPLDGDERV